MRHLVLVLALVCGFSAGSHAAFEIFDTRAAWSAALSEIQTENFAIPNTAVLAAGTDHALGLITFRFEGAATGSRPVVCTGVFRSQIFKPSSGGGTTRPGTHTFALPIETDSVGMDLIGAEILIFSAAGMSISVPDVGGVQFFGVVSDSDFASFTLSHNDGTATADSFNLDNVSFETVAITEPGTALLLGGALAGLGMLRKRTTHR